MRWPTWGFFALPQMRSEPERHDQCRCRHRYHRPTSRSGRKEQGSRETKIEEIVRASRADVGHISIEPRVDTQRSDKYDFRGIPRQAGVVWPKVGPSKFCAQACETSISASDQSPEMTLVSTEAPFFAQNERHTRTDANRIAEVDLPKGSDSLPPFRLAHNRRVLRSQRSRHAAEGQNQYCRRFHLAMCKSLHRPRRSSSALSIKAHIQSR
jgi:hypothetical protein